MTKEVNWQNIDSALHGLIVNEEGIKFQRLAIALATIRWPGLVATNPHKDGGEDAFLPNYFEKEGKYLSVACSLTATYDKIKGDAGKIIKRGKSLDILVFYTPESKSNKLLCDEWGVLLKKELGCDFLPIPKEDIILKLLCPENHWMCQQFLGLNIPETPNIGIVIENIKTASQEIIQQWKGNLIADISLIELSLQEKNKDGIKEINLGDITERLSNKHRYILYGPPGSGKTTTLVQIAEKIIQQEKIPLIISLPEWISSSSDNVIDFLIHTPSFSSRSTTAEDLWSLYRNGKLVFLLNGWNEIDSSSIKKASQFLTRLNREYTAAGIIIATRKNNVQPPFIDQTELYLKKLGDEQRRDLIYRLISQKKEDISIRIENNRALSEITRTPLFLVGLVQAYQKDNALPQTRVDIFEHLIRKLEQSVEHHVHLQDVPVSGRACDYLVRLSSYATSAGQVILNENDAYREITSVNTLLQRSGQLQLIPEPTSIISILCDHHLLVRSSYPNVNFRFVHQQFQEYYAYLYIEEWLRDIISHQEQEEVLRFQKQIINIPAWEESLRLLAEKVANSLVSKGDSVLKMGDLLVRLTISIDPIFAAELISILGLPIWDIVKKDFEPILRRWYECEGKDHKACALTAMFATGMDSFSDIIWPLLESKDDQICLETYHTAKFFMVSCLGINWQNRINKWDEKRRAEFMSELSLNNKTDISIYADYAHNDHSLAVKVAAIEAIEWVCSKKQFHDIVLACDDETFKMVVMSDYIFDKLSEDLWSRTTDVYLQLLKEQDNPHERLGLLLKIHRLDKANVISLLRSELEHYQPQKQDSVLRDVLKLLAKEYPDWIGYWVGKNIADGLLYYEEYSDYVNVIPKSLVNNLLVDFVKTDYSERLAFNTKKLIAAVATQEHVHFILQEIAKLTSRINNPGTVLSEPEHNLYHRLIDLIRLAPLQNLTEVVLEKYKNPDICELRLILDLLGCYRLEIQNENPISLQEETRKQLRQLLLKYYVDAVIKENDYSGNLKADMSCAIALFGRPDDLAVIKILIEKDIDRRKKGKEEWKKGVRSGPQINYWRTSWANWHIRGLLHFNSEEVEELLLQLLNEPEYEHEAANGLVQLLWKDVPDENKGFRIHVPLILGSHTWREKYINSTKREKYAQVIAQRIQSKRENQDGDKELAGCLARLNSPDTIPLVLEILQIPGQFDAYSRVRTLETLIRHNHCLDTAIVEKILDSAMKQAMDIRMSGKQDIYLFVQCLSILACTTDTARAMTTIDQMLAKHILWHDLRGLIETLGYRKNSDAANYLIHLCQQERLYKILCRELIEALGKTETPEAKQALLSTVDDSISSPEIPIPNHDGTTCIVQALSNIYKSDVSVQNGIVSLCQSQKLSQKQKSIIISIICNAPSNEAIIAVISMYSQENGRPIPYELEKAVEMSMIQYVPIEDMQYSYNIRPQVNEKLTKELFEIVVNKKGNWKLAFKLLGYINRLRIEHGRPQLEPRHPNVHLEKHWSNLVTNG